MTLWLAVGLSIIFGVLVAGFVLMAAGVREWWDNRERR